ncbi:MAG: CHAT domain-containing protein [Acidobacteriota bacterium]|nr:CHAT domain-containing protein [Acidobacteriota bacterium]
MIAYYQRLQSVEGRTEALRQVQLEMLKGGTARKTADAPQRGLLGAAGGKAGTEDRSHPFYWASFIQSGEWRAMESVPTVRD